QECEQQISSNDRTHEALVCEPRKPLTFVNCGEGEHLLHGAGWITTKRNSLRAVDFGINQRRNLPPFLQLAALILISFNCEHAVLVALDAELAEQRQNLQERCFSASRSSVNADSRAGVRFSCIWVDIDLRFARTREIAVHKRAQHFASAAANIASGAVVGNEIANARFRHEHHIAVKPKRIAAMSDD